MYVLRRGVSHTIIVTIFNWKFLFLDIFNPLMPADELRLSCVTILLNSWYHHDLDHTALFGYGFIAFPCVKFG